MRAKNEWGLGSFSFPRLSGRLEQASANSIVETGPARFFSTKGIQVCQFREILSKLRMIAKPDKIPHCLGFS